MDSNLFVLDAAARIVIIQNLSEKLRAYYVFPSIAEEICLCLQKHLKGGEYSDITEGEFFALALTLHMQEVNHDEHLWVRWHPEPLPDGEDTLRHNQEWQAERKLEAEQDNYGFHKVERLPGNVGYLDIHNFHRPEWGGQTAVAVMNFLAHARALIIRATLVGERTGGGAHPGASYRLHSHFEVIIPVGRVINPISGIDWEGTGVTPHISVPQEQAFMVLAEEARVALKGLEDAYDQ